MTKHLVLSTNDGFRAVKVGNHLVAVKAQSPSQSAEPGVAQLVRVEARRWQASGWQAFGHLTAEVEISGLATGNPDKTFRVGAEVGVAVQIVSELIATSPVDPEEPNRLLIHHGCQPGELTRWPGQHVLGTAPESAVMVGPAFDPHLQVLMASGHFEVVESGGRFRFLGTGHWPSFDLDVTGKFSKIDGAAHSIGSVAALQTLANRVTLLSHPDALRLVALVEEVGGIRVEQQIFEGGTVARWIFIGGEGREVNTLDASLRIEVGGEPTVNGERRPEGTKKSREIPLRSIKALEDAISQHVA